VVVAMHGSVCRRRLESQAPPATFRGPPPEDYRNGVPKICLPGGANNRHAEVSVFLWQVCADRWLCSRPATESARCSRIWMTDMTVLSGPGAQLPSRGPTARPASSPLTTLVRRRSGRTFTCVSTKFAPPQDSPATAPLSNFGLSCQALPRIVPPTWRQSDEFVLFSSKSLDGPRIRAMPMRPRKQRHCAIFPRRSRPPKVRKA